MNLLFLMVVEKVIVASCYLYNSQKLQFHIKMKRGGLNINLL